MMSILLLRYAAGFFLLTTIAMTGFAIYRGEVISSLQSKLIDKQEQQVKVIIDTTEMANTIGNQVQAKLNQNEIQKEVTVREVERIVKEPMYLNVCFDTAGMSELSKAISTSITNEPTK